MKKQLVTLAFFILSITVFGQSNNYQKGFQNGFKEGYCHNDYGCVVPVIPITPIPLIGEDFDNYQDGYNRGFKMGLEKKQINKSNSGGYQSGQRTYTPTSYSYVSQYVPRDLSQYVKKQNLKNEYVSIGDTWMEFNNENTEIYEKLKKRFPQDNKYLDEESKIFFENNEVFQDYWNTNNQNITESKIKTLIGIFDKIQDDYVRFTNFYQIRQYYFLGQEAFADKKYNDAIYYNNKYLNSYPNEVSLYYNNALMYVQLDNLVDAENELNKYLKIDKTNNNVYGLIGKLKLEKGDFYGAIDDFNKQIAIKEDYQGYSNRALAKSMLKDYYGSITDNTKAIELYPNYSMGYNNRGWTKYELNKYSEALQDLNKSIELDPTNWIAYDSRQQTKFMMNDFSGCAADCKKAIELNPKCSNSYLYLGRCKYKEGLKSLACEYWSKAGELGKKEAYDYISKYCNK